MAVICSAFPLPGSVVKETVLSVYRWESKSGNYFDTQVQLTFEDNSCVVYEFEDEKFVKSLNVKESGEYYFDSEGNYVFKKDEN